MATEPLAVLPKEALLLLYCAVDVKALFEMGKRYPWLRPPRCPKCAGGRLWSHGFSPRYFEGINEPLWIKRYRCPDCEAVHTCRPDQYFKRYRFPVVSVVMSLMNKIIHGRWVRCISRQNQLSWYRAAWAWCSANRNIGPLTLKHLRQYIADRALGTTQNEPLRL